jgi:hypothetical protein
MRRRSWKLSEEKGMTPYKLEAILRHYCEFRELYEQDGIEEITLEDGLVVNIHDVLRGIEELPKRQRTALILTCLYNLKEVEAAPLMGFVDKVMPDGTIKKGSTSPVSSYKKLALEKLVHRYWSNGSA